jgi:pimeloyl-ACP methyl ester carboxylesterase
MRPSTPLLVLIHGSWLGGWCWRPLRSALAQRGLAGLGDRAHLASPAIGLRAHAADIVEHLRLIDEDGAILVGHSYGGAVAAEAAALCPDIVRGLITLDGFTPAPGESIFGRHPELAQAFAPLIRDDAPDVIQAPDAAFLGLPPTPETDRLMTRLDPLPLQAKREARRPGPEPTGHSRHYVRFTGFPFFEETARRAAADGWQVSTIDAGHMAIVTDVDRVADRLAAIVTGDRGWSVPRD